ncbi:MAG: helix-turn-helix transcriptional regulator [Bacteroidaceae bacterium]|nr:helix-turn-helix transcriptional regulator [Bacteroidaceae bacterium]
MAKSYLDHHNPFKSKAIFNELLRLLTRKRMYLDPELTAIAMAELLGCSVYAISAAMRYGTGQNFRTLLAEIRARHAATMMANPKNDELTLEEISLASGFATRQGLHLAFQRFYNTTPHAYRKALRQSR